MPSVKLVSEFSKHAFREVPFGFRRGTVPGATGPYQGQPLSPRKCFKNVLGTRLEGTFECKARWENADILGNGPNTVSESTVSNTELSEFFGAH